MCVSLNHWCKCALSNRFVWHPRGLQQEMIWIVQIKYASRSNNLLSPVNWLGCGRPYDSIFQLNQTSSDRAPECCIDDWLECGRWRICGHWTHLPLRVNTQTLRGHVFIYWYWLMNQLANVLTSITWGACIRSTPYSRPLQHFFFFFGFPRFENNLIGSTETAGRASTRQALIAIPFDSIRFQWIRRLKCRNRFL